jgi:hypothetical protein
MHGSARVMQRLIETMERGAGEKCQNLRGNFAWKYMLSRIRCSAPGDYRKQGSATLFSGGSFINRIKSGVTL